MKTRGRKRRQPKRKPVGRLDPSRTAPLRRAAAAEALRRFARLRMQAVLAPSANEAAFDADQHPRDEAGRFVHGGGGILSKLKAVGAAVGHAEHAAAAWVKGGCAAAVAKLPYRAQDAVESVYGAVRAATSAAFVNFTVATKLAERVAVERGSTPEEAKRLAGAMATVDMKTFEVCKVAAIAGVHAAHLPAAVTATVPVATAGYLAYSIARDPMATARAAVGLVKERAAERRGAAVGSRSAFSGRGLGVEALNEETDALATVRAVDRAFRVHGYDDWYIALWHAALDSGGTAVDAVRTADSLHTVRNAFCPGEGAKDNSCGGHRVAVDSEEAYHEVFKSPGGSRYRVMADHDADGQWTVQFTSSRGARDSTTALSGDEGAGAVAVMRAVGAALDRFVRAKQPSVFRFSADAQEPSRVKLYDTASKLIAARHGYSLDREAVGDYKVEYEFARRRDATSNQELPPWDAAFNDAVDVRQEDDSTCGAAAAMSVGAGFGVGPPTLDGWVEELGSSTRPLAIAEYLHSLGLGVEARHSMSVADLQRHTDEGRVVVCPVQPGHYVVVTGVSGGRVTFQDPLRGEASAPASAWDAGWRDRDVDGREYVRFGIAVHNVFCATGDEGGVGPTCGRGHSVQDGVSKNLHLAVRSSAYRGWVKPDGDHVPIGDASHESTVPEPVPRNSNQAVLEHGMSRLEPDGKTLHVETAAGNYERMQRWVDRSVNPSVFSRVQYTLFRPGGGYTSREGTLNAAAPAVDSSAVLSGWDYSRFPAQAFALGVGRAYGALRPGRQEFVRDSVVAEGREAFAPVLQRLGAALVHAVQSAALAAQGRTPTDASAVILADGTLPAAQACRDAIVAAQAEGQLLGYRRLGAAEVFLVPCRMHRSLSDAAVDVASAPGRVPFASGCTCAWSARPTVNPFVSEAQRRACYAKRDPGWDCEEWEGASNASCPGEGAKDNSRLPPWDEAWGLAVLNEDACRDDAGRFASCGTGPAPVPWQDPPASTGKRGEGVVRKKGAEAQGKQGDACEAAVTALGFKSLLPPGQRSHRPGEVAEKGSTIDLEFDDSGKAYELKMCNKTATEYRLKAKKEEKDQKERFAELNGKVAYTLIGVRDEEKGVVHFYASKEPGLTGVDVRSKSGQKVFHYIGKVDLMLTPEAK